MAIPFPSPASRESLTARRRRLWQRFEAAYNEAIAAGRPMALVARWAARIAPYMEGDLGPALAAYAQQA